MMDKTPGHYSAHAVRAPVALYLRASGNDLAAIGALTRTPSASKSKKSSCLFESLSTSSFVKMHNRFHGGERRNYSAQQRPASPLPIGASRLSRLVSPPSGQCAIPSTREKLPVIRARERAHFDRCGFRASIVGEVPALFVKRGGKLDRHLARLRQCRSVIGDLAYEEHADQFAFLRNQSVDQGQAGGISQMQRSLERFRTRTMDLEQVHNWPRCRRQMTSLREWKAKGQIRYTGITYSDIVGGSTAKLAHGN